MLINTYLNRMKEFKNNNISTLIAWILKVKNAAFYLKFGFLEEA